VDGQAWNLAVSIGVLVVAFAPTISTISPRSPRNIKQARRRLDCGAGRPFGGSRRSIVAECGDQHTGGAGARGDPMGTTTAHQAIQVRGVFETACRNPPRVHFMPLTLGQAISSRQRGDRDRGVTTNPDKIDAFARTVTERPAGRYSWWTGGQRHSTFLTALQVERNVMFMIMT